MYQFISKKLAVSMMKHGIIIEKEFIIYAYGLEIFLSITVTTVTALTLSLLFNRLIEGTVMLVSFAFLRTYVGGYHTSSHAKCYIYSTAYTVVFFLITHIVSDSLFLILSIVFTILGATINASLSPVETPQKPINHTDKVKFRRISLSILAAEVIIFTCLALLSFHRLGFSISCAIMQSAFLSVILRKSELRVTFHGS